MKAKGKMKDPVWNLFSAWEEGKTSVSCKGCNSDVSAKALRLKAHREKCPELSKFVENGRDKPAEDQGSYSGDKNIPPPMPGFSVMPPSGANMNPANMGGGFHPMRGADWTWNQMVGSLCIFSSTLSSVMESSYAFRQMSYIQ